MAEKLQGHAGRADVQARIGKENDISFRPARGYLGASPGGYLGPPPRRRLVILSVWSIPEIIRRGRFRRRCCPVVARTR